MATVFNLTIDQGTDFSSNIIAKTTAGVVRDLTGFTGRGQLRRSYFSANTVSFSVNIPVPDNGNVVIALSNASTANLKYGRYVYDVELVETATGNVQRLQEGIVTVFPEVTR